MDVPGDGNCLFYACISQLQNCSTFTIEQASNMRNYLMDYLLLHADDLSGDSMSLTWHTSAMMHASEIQSELRHRFFFEMLLFLLLITMLITWDLPPRIDASMQTCRNYFWSLAGTPWILQCIRLTLAALSSMFWFKNLLVIQCYQPLLCAHSSL